MKLKGIELKGEYRVKFITSWLEVYDDKGNEIYSESSDGDWYRNEFDSNGNKIYVETSKEKWAKWEYDENNNNIYYENSGGVIVDKRAKELTVEEIEKLLGYKIKIKGENK